MSKRKRNRTLDPDRVLTVDPGAWAAAALWSFDRGIARLSGMFRVNGGDVRAIDALLRSLRPEKLVVESVYAARFASRQSVATMYRRQGHWVTLMQRIAVPVEEVAPETWQKRVPGFAHKMKRDERIALYTAHAQETLRQPKLTEDECAAACIGLWYIEAREATLVLTKPRPQGATTKE